MISVISHHLWTVNTHKYECIYTCHRLVWIVTPHDIVNIAYHIASTCKSIWTRHNRVTDEKVAREYIRQCSAQHSATFGTSFDITSSGEHLVVIATGNVVVPVLMWIIRRFLDIENVKLTQYFNVCRHIVLTIHKL